ncbi:unnamed protein product [Lampetra planeri]
MAPGPRVDRERESRRTRSGGRRKGKRTAPQGGAGEGACVPLGGHKAAAAWACRGVVQLASQGPLGLWGPGRLQQILKRQSACSVARYGVMRKVSPFDRRVTCLAWHPSRPGTLAVASKGGDVLLWDHRALEPLSLLLGNGPEDAVGGMLFDPRDAARVFVVSGDGSLLLRDVEGRAGPRGHVVVNAPQCVHRHHDYSCWYCSVDVSVPRQALAIGDNLGHLEMCGLEGTPIWRLRLHKKKVTHVEFHPHCEWLLASASVDQSVKLWDLRAITDDKSCLYTLPHDKPVNSAYFSPVDGARLLTTDQYDQIRVYGCSDWSTPLRTIVHPHRQFQHLTPIKATWHPRYDLAVIGRYPDLVRPGTSVEQSRSIDLFDTDSGALLCRLEDPLSPGIASVNHFNPSGELLASGMGHHALVWGEAQLDVQQRLLSELRGHLGRAGGGRGAASAGGGRAARASERAARALERDAAALKKQLLEAETGEDGATVSARQRSTRRQRPDEKDE